MNKSEFKKVLQGAVMGSHRDLETILELYMPLIEHHSYLYWGKMLIPIVIKMGVLE